MTDDHIIVEEGQFADGSVHRTFSVICSGCGEPVWINTITKNPRDYSYFCLKCNTFVDDGIIEEIAKMAENG